MDNQRKKMISTLLVEAMEREDLNGRGAAQCLNINPAYVSMIKNPNSWDSMGSAAWNRFEAWADTREPLKSFVLPEGEAVLEIFIKPVHKPAGEIVKKSKPEKEAPAEKPAVAQPDNPDKIREIKPTNELTVAEVTRQSFALDIEINLVLNGQRLKIA